MSHFLCFLFTEFLLNHYLPLRFSPSLKKCGLTCAGHPGNGVRSYVHGLMSHTSANQEVQLSCNTKYIYKTLHFLALCISIKNLSWGIWLHAAPPEKVHSQLFTTIILFHVIMSYFSENLCLLYVIEII
jgi:hypothetical protein